MVLKELEIENFRIFPYLKIEFSDGINIISGKNGQGKTSILESIYYLALTKSFRTSNDNFVVSYTKDHFSIKSIITSENSPDLKIRIYFSDSEGKHLFVNKKEITKFSEYIGKVPSVILTLDDLRLIKGGPQERRKFIDILISQISPVYLEDLKNYRRILHQRNALLNIDNEKEIKRQILIWNRQLVEHGTRIILHRLKFIDFLNINLSEYYNSISDANDLISVKYKSSISNNIKISEKEKIEEIYNRKLGNVFKYELERKTSAIGPHRDDVVFFKGGKIFKDFCSQGENKTLVVALKFLEWEYISIERKQKPILLLDDIFGELDESRIQGLLRFLEKIGQAYITTTMQGKFIDHPSSRKLLIRNKKIYDA